MFFQQSHLDYLTALRQNNNRNWFEDNRPRFDEVKEVATGFLQTLEQKMNVHDVIERSRLYRIYRDVRFSKDKTPYKTYLGGGLRRATAYRRGGYFFHIEAGNSFVAGGFFGPNAQDLLHIRKQIDQAPEELMALVADADFIKYFESLQGDQVKTKPRGFDAEHVAIEFLKFKQFIVRHPFDDQQVMSPDFVDQVDQAFQAMRPFLDYMSMILTTDLNGEDLLDRV